MEEMLVEAAFTADHVARGNFIGTPVDTFEGAVSILRKNFTADLLESVFDTLEPDETLVIKVSIGYRDKDYDD